MVEVRIIYRLRYIDTESPDFQENYIDMRMVIDFKSNEDGLQLYFADGTGYWIEI